MIKRREGLCSCIPSYAVLFHHTILLHIYALVSLICTLLSLQRAFTLVIVHYTDSQKHFLSESVDYGSDMICPMFPYRTAQNSQMQQLQALLDTHTKVRKYIATMTYGNWTNCTFVHHHLLRIGLKVASTFLGFYMKRLLSLACVILDQESKTFPIKC